MTEPATSTEPRAVLREQAPVPPSRPATAPTFINAEVTRVDATTGLVTFRSESGDVLVTGGREVTAGMSLHPGDKVLVAFQEIRDDSGRQSRVVTEVRSASPGSGGLTRTAVAASTKGNVRAGPEVCATLMFAPPTSIAIQRSPASLVVIGGDSFVPFLQRCRSTSVCE